MPNKCSATVYDPTGWGHSSSCSRNGKIEEDDKWWCKQHAPSSVKARSEASSARWQADQDRRMAPYHELDRLRAVNAKLLEALEAISKRANERFSASRDGLAATDANLDGILRLAAAALEEANK